MGNVLQFTKQNEMFLWIVLLLIVLVILLINLYLHQKAKINKTIKRIEGEREFYDSIFLEEESFYIHVNEDLHVTYVSPNFERMTGIREERIYADIDVLKNLISRVDVRNNLKKIQQWNKNDKLDLDTKYTAKGSDEEKFAHIIVINDTKNKGYLIKFSDISPYYNKVVEMNDVISNAAKESKAKTDFLSNMSHEIRTPMNGIIGMLSLARAHIEDKTAVEDYIEKIEGLSKFLLGLINDILDMSRIESGKMELETRPFNLNDLAAKIDNMFKGSAKDKGITFSIDMEDFDTPYVKGDEMRLSQVIINFVSNALKFTTSGGFVNVTFKQMEIIDHEMHIMIRVRDTGKGIKKDFISKIFRPFEQEDASTAHNYGGSGLGMAIADNIVKLMNGQILVDSEEGKGTEFVVYLSLPIAQEPVYSNEPDFATISKKEEKNGKNVSIEGVKILMAEDNDINAEIAQEILEMRGAVVTRARDGQEVIDIFKKNKYGAFDAILMDIQMPKMDGWEATKIIRNLDREDKNIPIIAMTANAFIEDRRHSIEVGMNGHINKPVDYNEIINIIGR